MKKGYLIYIQGDDEVVESYRDLMVKTLTHYQDLRYQYKLVTLDDWYVTSISEVSIDAEPRRSGV